MHRIYRTKFYGPVMINLYKENDVFIEIMGKSYYNFMKFGYVVELNTTNMSMKCQSVWWVLLKVTVQFVS